MEQPQEPTISDVLAAIGQLNQTVQGVVTRLEAVEQEVQEHRDAIPQMVEMAQGEDGMFAGLKNIGDENGGTLRQKVVGTDGLPRPVRGNILPAGTRVRLTPESETAQALARKGRQNIERLVGTVITLHFVNDNDEPKYRVRFPGLTDARGDGFYAHELVPA